MSKIYWDTNKCINLCKSVGVQFLSEEYLNNRTKYKYRCKCGNIFERRWDTFANRKSFYCSNCLLKKRHNSIMLKRKEKIEKEGCVLLNTEWVNNQEPMKILCKCGRVHKSTWQTIRNRKSVKCEVCLGHKKDARYIKEDMQKHGIEVIRKLNPSADGPLRTIYLYKCFCGNIYSNSYESQIKSGYGCPDCRGGQMTWTMHTVNQYCEEMGTEFLSDNYNTTTDKYKFRCIECGKSFYRTFENLRRYSAVCQECMSKSKGEDKISRLLTYHHIKHIKEKSFDGCIGVGGYKLRYDFYLPSLNVLIEFHGKQHYEPIDFFGGKETFRRQIMNDRIKRDFARKHNMKLMIIPYWEYGNIENVLGELKEAS